MCTSYALPIPDDGPPVMFHLVPITSSQPACESESRERELKGGAAIVCPQRYRPSGAWHKREPGESSLGQNPKSRFTSNGRLGVVHSAQYPGRPPLRHAKRCPASKSQPRGAIAHTCQRRRHTTVLRLTTSAVNVGAALPIQCALSMHCTPSSAPAKLSQNFLSRRHSVCLGYRGVRAVPGFASR